MAYFDDLSEYAYLPGWSRPGTKTIGWLDTEHVFPTAPPDDALLNALWAFCKVSVAQTRGGHLCPFCEEDRPLEGTRNGNCLLLGTSEIRVFSREGIVSAAPTAIYHYVETHHYKPPDEFVRALMNGPRSDSQEYFRLLRQIDLEWNDTSQGGQGYVKLSDIRPEDEHVPLIKLMQRNKRQSENKT